MTIVFEALNLVFAVDETVFVFAVRGDSFDDMSSAFNGSDDDKDDE